MWNDFGFQFFGYRIRIFTILRISSSSPSSTVAYDHQAQFRLLLLDSLSLQGAEEGPDGPKRSQYLVYESRVTPKMASSFAFRNEDNKLRISER